MAQVGDVGGEIGEQRGEVHVLIVDRRGQVSRGAAVGEFMQPSGFGPQVAQDRLGDEAAFTLG